MSTITRYHIPLYLAVVLLCAGAATAAPDPGADPVFTTKLAPFEAHELRSSEAVYEASKHAGIPITYWSSQEDTFPADDLRAPGFEHRSVTFRLEEPTLASILDAIVERLPDYMWMRSERGNPLFLPRAELTDPDSRLNIPVAHLAFEGNLAGVGSQLYALTQDTADPIKFTFGGGIMPDRPVAEERRISFEIVGGTLLDVVDAAVTAGGGEDAALTISGRSYSVHELDPAMSQTVDVLAARAYMKGERPVQAEAVARLQTALASAPSEALRDQLRFELAAVLLGEQVAEATPDYDAAFDLCREILRHPYVKQYFHPVAAERLARCARETQRVSEAHKALREAEALPDAEMYFGVDGIATARAALTAPAQS